MCNCYGEPASVLTVAKQSIINTTTIDITNVSLGVAIVFDFWIKIHESDLSANLNPILNSFASLDGVFKMKLMGMKSV